MIIKAIRQNKKEDTLYSCRHYCVEPFEQKWLQNLEIDLIREKVEDIPVSFFEQLKENDFLFIDSSHIIRPQGDVLFEYLELLPVLKKGVLVHIHDIFSPKDYPENWVFDHSFWNEQYLLDAFLTFNRDYTIIGALNFLRHNYRKQLASKCPIFESQNGREPAALWMRRELNN